MEELFLSAPSYHIIDQILDKMKSLKRVKLQNLSEMMRNKTHWMDIMAKMFNTQLSLQNIMIMSLEYDVFHRLCDGVEQALYQSNKNIKYCYGIFT